MLYIQVINPKNNLLGEKGVLEFENGTLRFHDITTCLLRYFTTTTEYNRYTGYVVQI